MKRKVLVDCDEDVKARLGKFQQLAVIFSGPSFLWDCGVIVSGNRSRQPAVDAIIKKNPHVKKPWRRLPSLLR